MSSSDDEAVGSLEEARLEETKLIEEDGIDGSVEQEQRKSDEAKNNNGIRFMAFPSYIFYLRDSFIQKTNTSLHFALLCKENA